LIAVLGYTIIYIAVSHVLTVGKMNSLRELNGISLNRDQLNKRLHKSYSELKNKEEGIRFSKFMGINVPENSTLYKITGKGIPYYYGAIVLDTINNKIINVTLKELD
jgi:hypothetical protein